MSLRSRCSDIVRQSSAAEDTTPTDDDDKGFSGRTASLGQDSGYSNSANTTLRRDVFHRGAASSANAGPSAVEEFFKSSSGDRDDSTNWAFDSVDAETCCLTSTGQMDSSDGVFSGCDKTRESNATPVCPNCGCCPQRNSGNGANSVRSEPSMNTRSSWSSASKKVSFQLNDRRTMDARISGEDCRVEEMETAVQDEERLKEKDTSKFWNRLRNANR